jgi:hypothetical protein
MFSRSPLALLVAVAPPVFGLSCAAHRDGSEQARLSQTAPIERRHHSGPVSSPFCPLSVELLAAVYPDAPAELYSPCSCRLR